jgi:hypothetical protein
MRTLIALPSLRAQRAASLPTLRPKGEASRREPGRRSAGPLSLLLGAACALAPRPARADGASGFMLQGLLGGGTSVIGIGPASSAVRDNPFTAMPSLRIGAMLRPLAIAANLSYFSAATFRSGNYSGGNVITIGPDIMPFVWRSTGGQARLYLLFGLNAGATINTSSGGNNSAAVTGGFTFGAGGNYFLHPSFALGVELGSRTQFASGDGGLLATSTLYAALSGSFVAGH